MPFNKARLIQLRIRAGLTQSRLADDIMIDVGQISRLESHKKTYNPTFNTVEKLAERFGVAMDEFRISTHRIQQAQKVA